MASAEELRLVARIATGDEAALRQLYARYGSLVYLIAVRVTGDRCAAEDVAQQVFIRVWERPAGFDPERGVAPHVAGDARPQPGGRSRPSRAGLSSTRAASASWRSLRRGGGGDLLGGGRTGRSSRRRAPGRPAGRRPSRLLRRPDVSRGCRRARHPRGDGEVTAASRAQAQRQASGARRPGGVDVANTRA